MTSLARTNNNCKEITSSELKQLTLTLQEGKEELFEQYIKIPYTLLLEQLIETKFPRIQELSASILTDVFEKFKYDLAKGFITAKQINKRLEEKTVAECKVAIPSENQMKQNMGLTKGIFDDLVQELQQGNQALFEKIYLNHFKKCTSYLRSRCGANEEQAHTCTMDALIDIRKDLIQGKINYGNLAFYITRRARMKLFKLKNKKSNSMKMVSIDALMTKGKNQTYKIFEIRDLIGKTFSKMCEDCKKLLERKYGDGFNYAEIVQFDFPTVKGSELKTKANTLAKKAERCRKEFKHIIENL